jgi:hypothetical protein
MAIAAKMLPPVMAMMIGGYRRSGSSKPSSAHRFNLAICRDQAKRADKQDFAWI